MNKMLGNNNTNDDDHYQSILRLDASSVDALVAPSPYARLDLAGDVLPGGAVLNKDAPATKQETDQEKKMRRVMANRRSAKESRERRKNLLNRLANQVDVLAAENQSMAKANTELRNQMQVLKQQLMIALRTGRQQQVPQQILNGFSDDCNTMKVDKPYQLTAMVKNDCLEPSSMQDMGSLWNTSDIWEPLLSAR